MNFGTMTVWGNLGSDRKWNRLKLDLARQPVLFVSSDETLVPGSRTGTVEVEVTQQIRCRVQLTERLGEYTLNDWVGDYAVVEAMVDMVVNQRRQMDHLRGEFKIIQNMDDKGQFHLDSWTGDRQIVETIMKAQAQPDQSNQASAKKVMKLLSGYIERRVQQLEDQVTQPSSNRWLI